MARCLYVIIFYSLYGDVVTQSPLIVCHDYYCSISNLQKLSSLKHFLVLVDFVGQEFGQSTAKMACLCTCLEPHLKSFMEG